MDLFHKIQGIIDANTPNIPEGDYLELCNAIGKLRERVKPPKFLLDQNEPLILPQYEPTVNPDMTSNTGTVDDLFRAYQSNPEDFEATVSDGQPQEWIYQELSDQELSEYVHQMEWSTVVDVSVVGE
jgi:hypothetical protein